MINQRKLHPIFVRILGLCSLVVCGSAAAATSVDLAPPAVSFTDKFGVNLMSGQISARLDTVSIGGALGLSHNLSIYSNDFSIRGYHGFSDKFDGRTRLETIGTNVEGYPLGALDVITVHDFEDSVQFTKEYKPFSDTRHSLTADTANFYWTKPNGTVCTFKRAQDPYQSQLTKIVSPNGFTINIDNYLGVTTNTGFRLKYLYVDDNRPIDPSKPTNTSTFIGTADSLGWSKRNPKYIQATNMATDDAGLTACANNNVLCSDKWPKATFTWPAGMPKAIYLGDNIFSVTSPAGGVTNFYLRAYDLAYDENGTLLIAGYNANERFSPRLIGIKPANATQQTVGYRYKNVFNCLGGGMGTYCLLAQTAGVMTAVSEFGATFNYEIGAAYFSYSRNNGPIEGGVKSVYLRTTKPGIRTWVQMVKGEMFYFDDYTNLPKQFLNYTGLSEFYSYTRGNLTKIAYGTEGSTLVAESKYADACTSLNQKYCNKPEWVTDKKGNKTFYTYHQASGEVASVQLPPNSLGVAAVTRNGYAQKTASYYQNGVKALGTPIWLKVSERTCINTATLGNACTGGAKDEVVTGFEYNNDNLLMTGMTVTAADEAGTITTRRTCYQYDIYGNRIGETQPKAGRTSCTN